MQKTVIVRKNKNHLYAVRFFSLVFVAVCLIITLEIKQNAGYIELLCSIFLVPSLIIWIYYETWKISFSSEKICKKCFFFTSVFEWKALKSVKQEYLFSKNGECIRMFFADGKSLCFKMKNRNAEKAKKIILSHCNIQIEKLT
ncbi:MAG: hypothetical protein IJW76_04890 [Clostridia bacterium]|nr:hypothetical protein [Clostridia bacterium]